MQEPLSDFDKNNLQVSLEKEIYDLNGTNLVK